MVIPLDVMIGYHTSIDMKHMYFQYYSTENNPHFYYQYHSVESNPHCIYLHIQYIYMYMALSQQTETSLCDHHHPCTPRRREAIEFPLISRYPGARPVAKPMSFGERRLRLSGGTKKKEPVDAKSL